MGWTEELYIFLWMVKAFLCVFLPSSIALFSSDIGDVLHGTSSVFQCMAFNAAEGVMGWIEELYFFLWMVKACLCVFLPSSIALFSSE